jgi:apolipoprotein N-acyltransferase
MVIFILSAFLVSAAFEPIGLWFFAVFGYAHFFRSLSRSKRPVLASFLFGAVLNGIVLHWTSKYVGALPWILLTLLQASFYIPVGWIYRKTGSLLWVIFTFLLFEEVRARFPFGGFAWTRIAFSQVESPLLPLVSYGGVLLLSLVTLLSAIALMRLQLKPIFAVIIAVAIVSLLPSNPQPTKKVSLIGIQGNTPSVGLEFNSRAKAVFYLHRDTTRKLVKDRYDAIIWPENSIDIDPRKYPEVLSDIRSLVTDLDIPLIAGVVLTENGAPANASVMYNASGEVESTYIKRYLTPFGEYMPLRKLAEFVSPFAESVNDFQPGGKSVEHIIKGERLSPIICYEIINDGLVREGANRSGAFIVQTNSATFANTPESAQQLAITRIRAIEHSREILSVSTVGISAYIDNNGVVKSQTAENVSNSISGNLGISTNQTIADKLGGVAPLLTLLFAALISMGSHRKFFSKL